MKRQLMRPVRSKGGMKAMIPCCYGVVYTIADNVLGIITDSASGSLDRLRMIDGVEIVEFRGRWCDLKCPLLRLPDVTRVLVPLDSVRAPRAFAVAAQRGRIW